MHVKLNAIHIFNRLSLLANQLPSTVKVNQTQFSTNCTNKSIADRVKGDDTYHEMKADAAKTNLPARKFIMSSSLPLQEDDLSRIDVKSLVSEACLFFWSYCVSRTERCKTSTGECLRGFEQRRFL